MMRELQRWWHFQQARWRHFRSRLTPHRLQRRFAAFVDVLWFIVKYPFRLTAHGIAKTWHAMQAAWTQLYLRYFFQGLLALMVVIAVGVLTAFAYLRAGEGLADLYRREGKVALATQDWGKASLCFERLVQLNPRDPEARFCLAQALFAGKKDVAQAQALLTQLAPLDREKGYAPAHLAQARQYAFTAQGGLTTELQKKMEVHLLRALSPSNVPPLAEEQMIDAKALLGRLYLTQGREAEAEPLLLSAASAFGQHELRLHLAAIYRKRNRIDQARDQCRLAMVWFRSLAEGNVDNIRDRIQWAKCHALMDEFPQAVAVLEKGLTLGDHHDLRAALADVYIWWAESIRERDPGAMGEYLAYLEKALAANPNSPVAISRLSDLTKMRTREGDLAKERLRELLAVGGASPLLHFAVGLVAYEENKQEEALYHWERAYELDPEMTIVGNNLAWLLANVEGKIDLTRALKIADGVVRAAPQVGIYHGTRGWIYSKMGRYREAAADLEMSLAENELNPNVNKVLAECYTELGNKSMAEEHLKLEQIKRKQIAESVAVGVNKGGG
jgi:tetratricopeptide (TPR) repeat protein